MENIFLRVFSFLFGMMVGSFLNALIYRLPRDINIAYPRSSCPHCQKLIYWYENIPFFSFIFLRGKCSGCGQQISWEYPAIELFSGVVAFFMAPKTIQMPAIYSAIFFFTIFCAFLVHIMVDLKHQVLPDLVNIYLGFVFFIIGILNYPIYHWALGGICGFGVPAVISYIFYKLKGQVGLGGGDIKLWGVLGIYLGPMAIMQNIFLSSFLGAMVGGLLLVFKVIKRETPIPFGPFIILVASLQIFFPEIYHHMMRYIS